MSGRIAVDLGSRSYDIFVGCEMLGDLPRLLTPLRSSRTVIMTDENVDRLYGDQVWSMLRENGCEASRVVIPPGEESKSMSTLEAVCDSLLEFGADRASTILALGGGVVGDIAGFAAATFMRGIRCVQVPTTLLAQVDSSIGGKTGVNLTGGKNLVGAFHQPAFVFADTSFLKTLPEREFQTGMAETIKYGIIRDAGLFQMLEDRVEDIKRRDPDLLVEVVARCSAIKAGVVSRDEREAGERAILNLGHTFGHALETLTGYARFTHGEAVAAGMAYAARLAVRRGLLSPDDAERMVRLIQAYGLPTVCRELSPEDVVAAMHHDKKAIGDTLRLILPDGIGSCRIVSGIPDQEIMAVLEQEN